MIYTAKDGGKGDFMLVWLLMLGAITLLWFMIPEAIGEKKKKLMFLWLSGLLLAFLMGSRCPYRSGSGDVYVYYLTYTRTAVDSIADIAKHYYMEESYLWINKFLMSVIPWGQFIIYLEAVVSTLAVFRFIYKNTENVYLGVVVYICTGGWAFFLTGFRQAFAISICLFAFEYMKKRQFAMDLVALGIVLFASLFHNTAWLFLLAFVMRKLKLNRLTVFVTVCITILSFVAMNLFVDMIEEMMGTNYRVGYEGNLFGGIVPVVVFASALLLSFMAWMQDKEYLEKYSFQISMLMAGLCLYLFRYNTVVFERMSYYFTIMVCSVLPNSVCAIKDKRTQIICKAFCIVLCMALFVYRISDSGRYYFYWERLLT